MDLFTFLTCLPNALDKDIGREFAAAWSVEYVEKGCRIATQGEPDPMERIILDGQATSQITDPEGRAVCVSFHTGPCVVTPNVARTRNGISLVSINLITDALVAQMDSRALTELMLASEPIREWANGILQHELARKADREWCLAALGGADRLAWFRKDFPRHEGLFGHYLIASFLGVTPVTLSRLRSAERNATLD
ncbi:MULTISPECIES: Crp/Fnr family transcriptional regulator [Falsihalocynthiibacter]|uniref:Crp/Fnr family transcriptional regulator n=1 Tax=Falsihalocynthiibacter TaxID=2854182 RepID=UPI0030033C67